MIAILAQFLAYMKHAMNGAKTPNWVKILLALCFLAAIYIVQFGTIGQLATVQKVATQTQVATIRMAVGQVRNDIADLQDELQVVAMNDSLRARRIEKKIDRTNARIDDINVNGTDGTNARLDELIQDMRRKNR